MANAIKILATGQLPATKQTLYTVPGATSALAKTIKLYNTHASVSETATLYVDDGGGSRKVATVVLDAGCFAEVDDLFLEAGDLIEGVSTNASRVDFVIGGMAAT